MKRLWTLLGGMGMIVASGAMDAARSEDRGFPRVTLYTPLLRGDAFNCNVVNVSRKTLQIALALYDEDGQLISPAQGNPATFSVPAGTAVVFPTPITPPADHSPSQGYCKFEVIGTVDPNAVRADLHITLTRTFGNNIPVFTFRTVEGH
jgi:hypothetical protein